MNAKYVYTYIYIIGKTFEWEVKSLSNTSADTVLILALAIML